MVEKIIGKRGYENDKKLNLTALTYQIGENITHIFVCRPSRFDYQTDELDKQSSPHQLMDESRRSQQWSISL